jgi:hypothetical protein
MRPQIQIIFDEPANYPATMRAAKVMVNGVQLKRVRSFSVTNDCRENDVRISRIEIGLVEDITVDFNKKEQ